MKAPMLLSNHNGCKMDKGRYVETDVSGYKAVIYVPSGIIMSRYRKPLITLILLSAKVAIWSLS